MAGTAKALHVGPPPPAFNVASPATGGPTVVFTFTPPSGVTHWLRDFGDGQTSTEQNPTHTYAAPGDYKVTLTVYGVDGLSSSTEKVVVVEIRAPPDSRLFLPAITR